MKWYLLFTSGVDLLKSKLSENHLVLSFTKPKALFFVPKRLGLTSPVFLIDPDIIERVAAEHQGSHGCVTWVSKKKPFCVVNNEEILINTHNLILLHLAQRLLISDISVGCLKITVVNAHDPHIGHPDRECWWKSLVHTCSALLHGCNNVYLCIDANTRFSRHADYGIAIGKVGRSSKSATHSAIAAADSFEKLEVIPHTTHPSCLMIMLLLILALLSIPPNRLMLLLTICVFFCCC